MGWTLTDEVGEFLAEAGGYLRSDPAANTVPLTILDALERGVTGYGDVLSGWWTEGGRVAGAFMRTGTHPLLATHMPERAAGELADELAEHGAEVPGVNATAEVAEAFAGAWRRRTGVQGDVRLRMRLYRLERLTPPEPPPPGTARVAGDADRGLVLDWYTAFHRDVGDHADVNPAVVDDRLRFGGITLWEHEGTPVAMAGRNRVVAGMSRVAPVYTPAELRRRGYGAAAAAAVTRSALDAGAGTVVLFADLANPTSNGVYLRIGYRAAGERAVIAFT